MTLGGFLYHKPFSAVSWCLFVRDFNSHDTKKRIQADEKLGAVILVYVK